MARVTIKEMQEAAAKVADEAVTLMDQIREKITDEKVLKIAEESENAAIEYAGATAEAEKLADVTKAYTATEEALSKIKNILNGGIVTNEGVEKTEKNTTEEAQKAVVEGKNGQQEEIKQFMYIGPSVKKLGLRQNMIFRGTKSDTIKHLSAEIQEAPEVASMIFETADAQRMMKKVAEKGNSINKKYEVLKRI